MSVNSSRRKARLEAKRSDGQPATRVHIRPVVARAPSGVVEHCLKCQGWIVVQEIDLSKKLEMRCLNCGWQPQYGQRVIQETEEARSIRRFTADLFGGMSSDLPSTPLEESFQRIDFSKRTKSR
ncbi:hypothetical protein [Candidatus Nitronereus thalassa]|uniref:Uncharacterized protein n=1 Tax=Candidatus Nitronereus thalassa TaxID=3020898 RepID=A0ABU3K9C7_9BACT|nr:hypothetical protein [Candidatus Nitronereus thalassa]MDT7043049.1 hypothetical protein [Candidatus Nitronereus thalassa]